MQIKPHADAATMQAQALHYLRLMDMAHGERAATWDNQGIPWVRRVLEHGKVWQPAPLAVQPARMTPRMCFQNCYRSSRENLAYCEGWAVPDNRVGLPLLHAWLINPVGHVLELTWDKPGQLYIGIPVNHFWHLLASAKTREYGIAGSVNARHIPANPDDWIHPFITLGQPLSEEQ